MCVLGALTGLAFAIWLSAMWEPLGRHVGETFDDFTFNFFNGRLDLGKYLVGLLAGAALGFMSGSRIVRLDRLAGRIADPVHLPSAVLAAGAFMWLCLCAVVGVALGGWIGRSGTAGPQQGPFDPIFREYGYRQWGALLGSFVGYALFLWACGLLSSSAEVAAENVRLRGEVARLRQNLP
jgi:hypothetical protein